MAITLEQGRPVPLRQPDGSPLDRLLMGVGWRADTERHGILRRRRAVDLDASCLMFDAAGAEVDVVWFGQLESRCTAVRHSGDDDTGSTGDEDDEAIVVELDRVDARIVSLLFVVTSHLGQDFKHLHDAHCRLVDDRTGEELARYELSARGDHTALVLAKVVRDGEGWTATALGQLADGRTGIDLVGVCGELARG